MSKQYKFVAAMALLALPLAACSTTSSSSAVSSSATVAAAATTEATGSATTSQGIRIDVVTHGAAGCGPRQGAQYRLDPKPPLVPVSP